MLTRSMHRAILESDEIDDGLIIHLWSGVLLVVHAKHNRAVGAEFQQKATTVSWTQ